MAIPTVLCEMEFFRFMYFLRARRNVAGVQIIWKLMNRARYYPSSHFMKQLLLICSFYCFQLKRIFTLCPTRNIVRPKAAAVRKLGHGEFLGSLCGSELGLQPAFQLPHGHPSLLCCSVASAAPAGSQRTHQGVDPAGNDCCLFLWGSCGLLQFSIWSV